MCLPIDFLQDSVCVLSSETDKSFLERFRDLAFKRFYERKEKLHKMIQDTRWPALPMMALRGAQMFMSIILLGCSSYVVSKAAIW